MAKQDCTKFINLLYLCCLVSTLSWSQNLKPGDVEPNAKVIEADRIFPFSNGVAVIDKGDASALISATGELIIPFLRYQFEADNMFAQVPDYKGNSYVYPLKGYVNGLARVRPHGVAPDISKASLLYIDTKGIAAFPTRFTVAYPFLNGKALVYTQTGKGYFLYRNGSQILQNGMIKPPVTSINYDSWKQADLCICQSAPDKFGFCDLTGRLVIACQYDAVRPFSEGIAKVMKRDKFGEKKWAFINTKGQNITDFIFSIEPHDFHCGLAAVRPKDNSEFDYAYIDRTGKVKISVKAQKMEDFGAGPDVYNWVDFKNGYARWRGTDLWKGEAVDRIFVDTTGKRYDLRRLNGTFTHFGKQYSNVKDYLISADEHFQHNKLIFSLNSAKGMVDIDGNIVIPPIFSSLSPFDPVSKLAYAVYRNNPKPEVEGYINEQGVFVLIKGKGSKW
ncbi:WG repeat-containing protein [Spirosoma koreense]